MAIHGWVHGVSNLVRGMQRDIQTRKDERQAVAINKAMDEKYGPLQRADGTIDPESMRKRKAASDAALGHIVGGDPRDETGRDS